MKYYLIALNGFSELLRKRFKGGSLFDYARKENFDGISGRGRWGRLYLGKTLERAYYSLFGDEKYFPGESFIRAKRLGISVGEGKACFLASFMMQVDGRVLEPEVQLTDKEKYGLLEALLLSVENRDFEFRIKDGKAILLFDRIFPREAVLFPRDMRGRAFASHLYRNKELEGINRLITSSADILPSHPINRVREDLGELSANLLWLWGLGMETDAGTVDYKIDMKKFYLPLAGDSASPAELLGFQKIADLRETEEASFTWINFSLAPGDGYAIWLRQFEKFDMGILGELFREYMEEKCRILFIFDEFLYRDAEARNPMGRFLWASGNSCSKFGLRKNFRNGRSLIERFLA